MLSSKGTAMAKSENNFIKIGKDKKQSGSLAFLTYIGAAVYFVNQVDGFWNIIAALLKAAVWPAILIYNILQNFTA
jgi:hypothetical protein